MTKVRNATAVAVVLAALAAPMSAGAWTDYPTPAEVGHGQPVAVAGQHQPHSAPEGPGLAAPDVNPSNGFSWADAGIGAAVALCMLGLGAGVVALGRRVRPGDPAAS